MRSSNLAKKNRIRTNLLLIADDEFKQSFKKSKMKINGKSVREIIKFNEQHYACNFKEDISPLKTLISKTKAALLNNSVKPTQTSFDLSNSFSIKKKISEIKKISVATKKLEGNKRKLTVSLDAGDGDETLLQMATNSIQQSEIKIGTKPKKKESGLKDKDKEKISGSIIHLNRNFQNKCSYIDFFETKKEKEEMILNKNLLRLKEICYGGFLPNSPKKRISNISKHHFSEEDHFMITEMNGDFEVFDTDRNLGAFEMTLKNCNPKSNLNVIVRESKTEEKEQKRSPRKSKTQKEIRLEDLFTDLIGKRTEDNNSFRCDSVDSLYEEYFGGNSYSNDLLTYSKFIRFSDLSEHEDAGCGAINSDLQGHGHVNGLPNNQIMHQETTVTIKRISKEWDGSRSPLKIDHVLRPPMKKRSSLKEDCKKLQSLFHRKLSELKTSNDEKVEIEKEIATKELAANNLFLNSATKTKKVYDINEISNIEEQMNNNDESYAIIYDNPSPEPTFKQYPIDDTDYLVTENEENVPGFKLKLETTTNSIDDDENSIIIKEKMIFDYPKGEADGNSSVSSTSLELNILELKHQ